MKQLKIKLWVLKSVMLCLLVLGSTITFGQTKKTNLKATVNTNENVIYFQKKYIKQLKTQLKCNRELLSFVEREISKNRLEKKYSKQLKVKLKRNKKSLNSVKKEIMKWEEKLSSIGDDAQLANIELQNMLQKQQQTLQTMSNVSKMLHDTAMAIIRKIG